MGKIEGGVGFEAGGSGGVDTESGSRTGWNGHGKSGREKVTDSVCNLIWVLVLQEQAIPRNREPGTLWSAGWTRGGCVVHPCGTRPAVSLLGSSLHPACNH